MKSANLALSDIQLIVNHTTVATIYEMKSIVCKFHMKSFEGKKITVGTICLPVSFECD